jgi:methionyl-tRNA formyltransferase
VGVVEARPRKKKIVADLVLDSIQYVKKLVGQSISATLKNYCAKATIPYWYMSDGCSGSLEQWIRNLHPDLICVYSMSELLRENILQIPRLGTINLHPSLLPKYRGANPYFWIMLNEEVESGATIHYIDKGEDTGDILAQEAFAVDEGMTVSELQARTVALGVQLMLKAVDELDRGSAKAVAQPPKSPTVRARRVKSDEYHSLIRWEEWSAQWIRRLLDRGVFHLADLFPDMPSLRWKRWTTLEIVQRDQKPQLSGTLRIESEQCMLYCGDGVIRFAGRCLGLKHVARMFIEMLP